VIEATDIIMIHQLLGRYGHTIDGRDWEGFGRLFIADATIDYRSGTGAAVMREGRDAIVAWFREVDVNHPPAHHVTNIVVDERADPAGRVPVHSKFIAPFTRPEHVPTRLYGGDYHDEVVRTADGWCFAHKQCLPRWQLTPQVDDTAVAHRRTY
jgi:3-phenylpropionate/cinnamic acid dioxygenase small subunit